MAPLLPQRDASGIFDVFAHSEVAHELMRSEMLRFDSIAHVGRFGSPHLARAALPRAAWNPTRDLTELAQPMLRMLRAPRGLVGDMLRGLERRRWIGDRAAFKGSQLLSASHTAAVFAACVGACVLAKVDLSSPIVRNIEAHAPAGAT